MTPDDKKLMKALGEWRESQRVINARGDAHTQAQGGSGELEDYNLREAYDRVSLRQHL